MVKNVLAARAGCLAPLVLAACSNSGVEANFDRSSQATALTASADLSAPSNLVGVTGQATYDGVALVTLPAPGALSYSTSADARLVADFDNQSISGNLTNWTDMFPLTHELRGSAVIFGGAIDPVAGTFDANLAGNLERKPRGVYDASDPPLNYVFNGAVTGTFHDSLAGDPHSHVLGTINAPLAGPFPGVVTGGIVARQ